MLKHILNLKGVQQLNKTEKIFIKGGVQIDCTSDADCSFRNRVCGSNGYCITPQCTSNAQCGAGYVCTNYSCISC
ncbi:hypothetical protein [uncultured Aquimarina sp.]|uniref:hypothetical protein n=1 Tax=uncultured Aquimarina sp. TaxID=575652 RepID=UPI00263486C8|nr:hypothetical protein [uncultured Aquimarina sp.]